VTRSGRFCRYRGFLLGFPSTSRASEDDTTNPSPLLAASFKSFLHRRGELIELRQPRATIVCASLVESARSWR